MVGPGRTIAKSPNTPVFARLRKASGYNGFRMIWEGFRRSRRLTDAGERFRAEHSRFLTLALRSGRKYPRIPTKRVDQGGFSGLMKLSEGEKRASMWWTAAMNRVDDPR